MQRGLIWYVCKVKWSELIVIWCEFMNDAMIFTTNIRNWKHEYNYKQ